MSTHHILHSSAETVHWGFFDAALSPVLQVDSGDLVTIHCVSGEPEDMPNDPSMVLPELRDIHARCERGPGPHILTGPVWVNGAKAGDVLEVKIGAVELRQDWGWNLIDPELGTLPEICPEIPHLHIPLYPDRMAAELPWGSRLPLSPFFGVIGVAPPAARGRVSSTPPAEHGGNLDNRELKTGATLFLPVWNDGALFSTGDGHATQGDGEVCLTAIEAALKGTFQLIVRKDLSLRYPLAETEAHYITMGMHPDLDEAAKQALREMITLLGRVAGLSPEDAYRLCSMAAELRVTQLVDRNKGIHVMLSKDLLPA